MSLRALSQLKLKGPVVAGQTQASFLLSPELQPCFHVACPAPHPSKPSSCRCGCEAVLDQAERVSPGTLMMTSFPVGL